MEFFNFFAKSNFSKTVFHDLKNVKIAFKKLKNRSIIAIFLRALLGQQVPQHDVMLMDIIMELFILNLKGILLLLLLILLLLVYSITRLLDYSITRLLDYSITRLLDYSITRLLDYSINRLLDYSITWLLDYLIT
jgi:hypothetical protein